MATASNLVDHLLRRRPRMGRWWPEMDQRSILQPLVSLPDVVMATDPGGLRILDVNRDAGDIFGYTRAELLELAFSDLFPRLGAAALTHVFDAGYAPDGRSGTL